MREQNNDEDRLAVLDRTVKLLEYLSAVARELSPKLVRDVRDHPFCLWSTEVPSHPSVKCGPPGSSNDWLSVDRVDPPAPVDVPTTLRGLILADSIATPDSKPTLSNSAIDAAVRQQFDRSIKAQRVTNESSESKLAAKISAYRQFLSDEFADWVNSTWSDWKERTAPHFAARRLYGRLYDLYLESDTTSATREVVWGHAIASYRSAVGDIVTPILTTNVALRIDSRATIKVTPEGPTGLELDVLDGTGIDASERLFALRESMLNDPPDPWTVEDRLAVRQQVVVSLGKDASLVETNLLVHPATRPQLNDGWVLFLRDRPKREERFYRELAKKIRDECIVPPALASVVADSDQVDRALRKSGHQDDGTATRLLMPLPANDEQSRIARQLATSRGVTVQGPPGTGKSHTIVNLVSHLVAQGKRVLVTAEKEQALTVLRDKIPEPLRDLSIAALGSTPAAITQLRASAQSMQDSISSIDIDAELAHVARLGESIDRLRASLTKIDATLIEVLASEQLTYRRARTEVRAPQVAKWLGEDQHLDIVKQQIRLDSPCPVTATELSELQSLLRSVPAEHAVAAAKDLPVDAWIPSGAALEAMLARQQELTERVDGLNEAGLKVESLDHLDHGDIAAHAHRVREAAQELTHLSGTWEDALAAAVRASDPAATWVTERNSLLQGKLSAARKWADTVVGHVIELPDGNPAHLLELTAAWTTRLSAGKKLPVFGARSLKEFSARVLIDGYPPTSPTQLELVRATIECRVAVAEARTFMQQIYTTYAIPVPNHVNDPQFLLDAERISGRVESVRVWWTKVYPELSDTLGRHVTIADPAGDADTLRQVAGLFDSIAARREQRELRASLEDLKNHIVQRRSAELASPLWNALASAFDRGDSASWESALEEGRRLASLRTSTARIRALIDRISAAGASRWAREIERSRGADSVVGNPATVTESWERAKAHTWLKEIHDRADVASLMTRSHAESDHLQKTVVDMASRLARVELKRNLGDRQRRALNTWLEAIKKYGKGTGKSAARFDAQARQALPAAMGAVPIWIMPIYRVLQNFDPYRSEQFDVVVVDESSQCNLLSLGILALGKKVIVVGDDKQTTPDLVGVKAERISALQDQHIRSLDDAKLLTLDESLYSISARAFPSTIALKEHFRCVPEIIGFSNRFYDNEIRPLREISEPQLGEPIRPIHVPNAVSEIVGSSRVNLTEATAIADRIDACCQDPRYAGLTFGVVTLMSGDQSKIIQNLVRDRIGDAEFEKRRIRVGNPPLFQGDERNVMFISPVAHDNSFTQSHLRYTQWANVAVSRAQDQLWVFYSMDPSTLHPNDQRRAIIEYALGHQTSRASKGPWESVRSRLEHDVLDYLLKQDLDVIAKHKVGNYEIDFVLNVAPGERLALECDGDSDDAPETWAEAIRRQRVLERLGWTFWRIRASEFYLDPDRSLAGLLTHIKEIRKHAERRNPSWTNQRLTAAPPIATQLDAPPHPPTSAEPGNTAPPAIATAAPVERTSAPTGTSTKPAVAPSESRTPGELDAIRSWARTNGLAIGRREVVPKEILSAYDAIHPSKRNTRPTMTALGDKIKTRTWRKPDIEQPARPTRPAAVVHPAGTPIDPEPPTQAELDEAWKSGKPYRLDAEGDIMPEDDGRALADIVENSKAQRIRLKMQAHRIRGGWFKVNDRGVMVGLTDGVPTFVCQVTRDDWFPSHWE